MERYRWNFAEEPIRPNGAIEMEMKALFVLLACRHERDGMLTIGSCTAVQILPLLLALRLQLRFAGQALRYP